nr:MAG: Hom-end-associated Hint [Bacteriophage sp.]
MNMDVVGFCSIETLHLQLNPTCTILIKAPNGKGKAQPLEEPVLTANGWKKMGELTLNDKVINPVTGKPIKLLGIYDRGLLDTYKITFSDGSCTECAGDHLWSVFKSGKAKDRLRTLDTETLLKDYKVENKTASGTFKYRYSTPLTVPIDGNYTKLPIHPYVLGFILGDGCISGNRPTVRVSTNREDWPEIVDRLRSYLPDPNLVHEGTEVRGAKHFRIHGLGKELKDLGLIGCKSKDKFIPELYLKSSIENRRLLLAGLLDTDGCVGSKKKISKVSTYSSKSEHLRDGISYLVRSLGGLSTKNESTRFKYGRYTTSYVCSIRLTFNPFLRKYKTKSYGEFTRRNRMVNTIRNIEYIGKKVCRCIKVDSSEGLYITRDFIVTHNSTILSALVWAIYGKNLKGVSDVNTWKEVRPKDYKGTMVQVFFQKDTHTYKIIRCQKYEEVLEDGAKGKDRLVFIKDGDIIDIKGKGKIQDALNREIGLSYTLFMNSIMFGQGIKRLIQESNSDKKKIFEEVFDLEFLNLAKGIALQDKNNIVAQINEVEHQSQLLKKELEANREAYFDLRDREKSFKKKNREERKSLKQDREKLTELLIQKQKQIKDEVDASIKIKIKNQNKLISDIRGKLNNAKKISNVSLKEVIKELVIQLEGGNYKRALRDAKSIYNAFSDIEKYEKKYSKAQDRLGELENVDERYKKLKSDCDDIADDLASIDGDLAKLKQEKLKVMSPKYKQKLKEIRKNLRKVDEDFHNKELELENYNWLINDPLGNNGIKAYLFDSSLEFLNRTLDKYSEVLGFRIEFNIDLGTARKDFVTLIERDGMIMDYDELSGGEKQLCNVAMAFAMNESLTASKGINIAFLDEVFESLSSDNVEVVTSLIRHIFKEKTLFLITHLDSLPLGNTKILQVEKTQGLSKYQLL